MIRGTRVKCFFASWLMVLWIGLFLFCTNALGGEISSAPKMPTHWKMVSDFPLPAEQVKTMSSKLGANLSSVRNTVYAVNGKRVQINVIVASDSEDAKKLMTKLRSMKAEKALLRKGLIVYEFVGKNDALPLIAEGRKYLDSK